MDGAGGTQTARQSLPPAAGPQHVENGGHGLAIIHPGAARLLLQLLFLPEKHQKGLSSKGMAERGLLFPGEQ